MTETEFSLELGASMGTSAVGKWWKLKKFSDLKNIPKLNWATWFKTHYYSRPADGRYSFKGKVIIDEITPTFNSLVTRELTAHVTSWLNQPGSLQPMG